MVGWKFKGMGGWGKKAKLFQKELLLQTLDSPNSSETIYYQSIVVPIVGRVPTEGAGSILSWGSSLFTTPEAGRRRWLKGSDSRKVVVTWSLTAGFPDANRYSCVVSPKEVAEMHIGGIFPGGYL